MAATTVTGFVGSEQCQTIRHVNIVQMQVLVTRWWKGDRGVGARKNKGWEGYGKRERKGQEAGVLKGREAGEN